MKLTRPRVIAVGLAATLFAMSIVSMALGGPSVDKLVAGSNKAHTATKVKRGPRGPRGFPGPQGLQGLTGADGVPGGASLGAATGPGTPPATANGSLEDVSINLPQPAKLFVIGSSTASVTCTGGGGCTRTIGLYVDSSANPITNSEFDIEALVSSTVTRDATLLGVTPTLSAGSHTIHMYSNESANTLTTAASNSNIGVISLTG
jgi:hypothetical protein